MADQAAESAEYLALSSIAEDVVEEGAKLCTRQLEATVRCDLRQTVQFSLDRQRQDGTVQHFKAVLLSTERFVNFAPPRSVTKDLDESDDTAIVVKDVVSRFFTSAYLVMKK